MKAYFTASIAGKKYHFDNYRKIIDILLENGVDVAADHIVRATEDSIRLETREQRIKFQKKLEGFVNTSDFMIVEASFPSISVGYEIALALHRGKPVLVLYSEGDSPSLIVDNEEERLVVEKYTPNRLEEIIKDFINYVKGGSDTRFTFFVTSEIASYLDKVAKKSKVPKSVYLRNLIVRDMRGNG